MHVTIEHSGELPVKLYGGTERIIYWHMKELVKQGHKVTLIGHPNSDVKSIGVDLIPKTQEDWRVHIPKDTDVVHLFYTTSYELDVPLLTTIEGNGRPDEWFHKNTVFVSASHARNHGAREFVYNGIDFDEYPDEGKKNREWNDFMFLNKARWKVKNLDDCVRVAKELNMQLHVCGGRAWTFSKNINSYGMVGQAKKREILSKCDALLWPVRWHEPFGIGIIEAFAYGLPVIGSSYGSLPELLTEGVGKSCKDYGEFRDALRSSKDYMSPTEIREHCKKHFSSEVMTKNYVNYYERIITGEELHEEKPMTKKGFVSEELLSF